MPTDGPIDDSDIVAIGADLAPGTLLAGYRAGLFPMPFDRRRIAWFSPDPRGIMPLDGLRVSRSLCKSMRRYDVRIDTCFTAVMDACGDPNRPGAWIDPAFVDAYTELHELGWAHSVEVYEPGSDGLVGGVYGVRIDGLFAGESMFHRATDASKVALVHLVDWLRSVGAELFDVQWQTPHLASLGVIEITRSEYLERLRDALS
jgi:leucyl/phenylalanyl-tRNA--protein transferase